MDSTSDKKEKRTSEGVSKETIRSQQENIIKLPGESWLGRLVFRPVSVGITPVLARTSLTPNSLTILSHVFGIVWIVLWSFPYLWSLLGGLIGFSMWLLFDVLDGDLARAKNKLSLRGVYLDTLGHHIVNPALFSALAIQIFQANGNPLYLYLALPAFIVGLFPRILDDSRLLIILEQKHKEEASRHKADLGASTVPSEKLPTLNPKVSQFAGLVRKWEDIASLALIIFSGCLIEMLIGGTLLREILFFVVTSGILIMSILRGIRYIRTFR